MSLRMIKVGGVQLELRHIPSPTATPQAPLVFLHEGLGSVAMWRDWPEQVCARTGRAGWVYSRQGYGQSDPVPDVRGEPVQLPQGQRGGRLLPDYMHREAQVVLPELLSLLGVERPVLLGHSDGGSIALLHASRHPVSACIVMAPHVVVEDVSITSIAQARDAFLNGDLSQRLARYHADVDGAFWQWNEVWLSEGFRSFDIRPDCRQITAPVLALQGLDDPYGTRLQVDEIEPEHAPIQREYLSACAHSPHREQSEITLALIQSFLETRD